MSYRFGMEQAKKKGIYKVLIGVHDGNVGLMNQFAGTGLM